MKESSTSCLPLFLKTLDPVKLVTGSCICLPLTVSQLLLGREQAGGLKPPGIFSKIWKHYWLSLLMMEGCSRWLMDNNYPTENINLLPLKTLSQNFSSKDSQVKSTRTAGLTHPTTQNSTPTRQGKRTRKDSFEEFLSSTRMEIFPPCSSLLPQRGTVPDMQQVLTQ